MMKTSVQRISMCKSAALLCAAIAFTSVVAQEAIVPTLEMDWSTVDGGGGMSAADGYSMEGTIGQIDAGSHNVVMTGGGFEFSAGFWPGVRQVCLGDVAPIIENGGGEGAAGDGAGGAVGDGVVNVQDLLAIINHWNTNHWLYDIAPPGGDGTVNVLDMIAVLNAWGVCP